MKIFSILVFLFTSTLAHSEASNLNWPVIAGNPSAGAVKIVVFIDLQSPYYTVMQAPVLKKLIEMPEVMDSVRLELRHFPIVAIHDNSIEAAVATVCAHQQGKFWPMHDALAEFFKHFKSFEKSTLNDMAYGLSLNQDQFEKCLSSKEAADLVASDRQRAENLRLEGAPSLTVNNRIFLGARSIAEILQIVKPLIPPTIRGI